MVIEVLTIRMSRAVNVTVMPVFRLVLDVSRVNRNTTSLLFGRLVNHGIVGKSSSSRLGKSFSDSRGKSSLSMVDVTDGTDVHVGLCSRILVRLGISTTQHCRS